MKAIMPSPATTLLQSLTVLVERYEASIICAENMIAAMVGGDFAAVQESVARQALAHQALEAGEFQRKRAESALARSLGLADTSAGGPKITVTKLAAMLPRAHADELLRLRRELLRSLTRLQALQSHSSVLARGALAALRRTSNLAATTGEAGYGPNGERRHVSRAAQQGSWRSA